MPEPHVHTRGWRARGPSAAVLLLVSATACVGMVRVKKPVDYFGIAHPKIVRVTNPDGSRFIMVGAHLENDTLMGFVQRASGIHQFEELSLTNISKVEAEQRDPKKTAVAISAGVIGFGAAWYALYRQAEKQGTSQFCIGGLYGAGIPCD